MAELGHGKSSDLSIAILAGGKSTRMGVDKGLMKCNGSTMIAHILHNLTQTTPTIFIITNEPEDYKHLEVPVFPDVIPGKNALGGVFSALCHAETEYVAVLACDMIFANTSILLEGLQALKKTGADVAVPKTAPDYFEPLHAVYRTATCKPAVLEAIQQGHRRLISWFSSVLVHEIDPLTCLRLDPDRMAFFNINTLEDKAIAESYLATQNKTSPK